MGWFDRLMRGMEPDKEAFKRGREDPIHPGRHSAVVESPWTSLSPLQSRTKDVLANLRQTHDSVDALDLLRKENPDVSMACWNFIRLANVGHDMEFYGVGSRNKGKRLTDVEARWKEFASRVNELSNSGLDGLMDQLHYSAFMRRGQGVEVEVASSLDEVVDVYPVDPHTVTWKLEEQGGRKVWVPYQQQFLKEPVDLSRANFYWVPTDPDLNDPRGNLIMGSVLQAIDFQMQVLQDLQAVIHNQGWPRYDIALVLERVMAAMPAQIKADPKKQKEWIGERIGEIQNYLRNLKPDDSFVHTDDVQMGKMQGGEVTRSVDVRAIAEMLDTQMMSGTKQMGIFMNRNSGVTETWGSIGFRIFVSGITSIQRGSKRLMEDVARLWLRVNGIQADPKFTHRTIDWESEEARWKVKQMQQEFWKVAQEMGWVDPDKAAQEAVGVQKAHGKPTQTQQPRQGGGTNEHDHDSNDAPGNGRYHRERDSSHRPMRVLRSGDATESGKGGD